MTAVGLAAGTDATRSAQQKEDGRITREKHTEGSQWTTSVQSATTIFFGPGCSDKPLQGVPRREGWVLSEVSEVPVVEQHGKTPEDLSRRAPDSPRSNQHHYHRTIRRNESQIPMGRMRYLGDKKTTFQDTGSHVLETGNQGPPRGVNDKRRKRRCQTYQGLVPRGLGIRNEQRAQSGFPEF